MTVSLVLIHACAQPDDDVDVQVGLEQRLDLRTRQVRIAVRTEPPPAKVVAAKPLPRAVRKAQPARAPAAAEPPVLATQSLLDAPSPDGEPVPEAHAAAENGPPEGATNQDEQPTQQLL